jgi:hypothetical protein
MDLSALFGGLTGLLGTGLTYVMDYFKTKQEAAIKEREAQLNREIAALELEKAKVLAASNVQVAISQGEAASFVASYESDKATYINPNAPTPVQYMLGFVDFLRGFIRPGTTIGYGILFAWLVAIAVGAIGIQELANAKADELVDAAIYLATSTTMWWFGVRPLARK